MNASSPHLPVLTLCLAAALPLGAAESAWEPVECVPADPTVESLFEVVRPVEDFEGARTRWRVATGDQQAAATARRDAGERRGGEAAWRVDYEFTGRAGLEYLHLNGPAEFERPGLGLGFWLKSEGAPLVLRMRFTDASGETHQTELLDSGGPGWRFVAGALDSPSEAWGGDGNKRKDYPCRLVGIVLDRPQPGFHGRGSLWLDEVAVVRAVQPPTGVLRVEARPLPFGNLYAVGDTVRLRARGEGERIRWSFADFEGRELARGEGAATSTEATLTLEEPGWLVGRFELIAAGRVTATRLFPCAALANGRVEAASDFLGMCSHFGQNAYPLETMELMRRFGVDQFRDEVYWRSYEREKGRLAMPAYAERYLRRAAELKMRPLLIFNYSNPHYDQDGFPNSPEAIAAFARYAVDLSRQTRGVVNQFEVWNEWVGACGMSGRPGRNDGEAYGRLLKPVYEAVKGAFPDVTVVGIGGEYGPQCAEHIEEVIRVAGPASMDAWSIHPYRYPRAPEASDLLGEVRSIASRVAAAGVAGRAWITEIGYPTHRGHAGSSPAAQARLAVRTVALLQSLPEVEKVFWYAFKDDGLTREYNEHNFGVVHHERFNCAPKPAAVALAVFIARTAGARVTGREREGDVWAVGYERPNGESLVVAWSAQGTSAPAWEGEVRAVTDLMGRPLAVSSAPQLTGHPVYLSGRGLRLRKSPRQPRRRFK